MTEKKVEVPCKPQVEAQVPSEHADPNELQPDVLDTNEPESWKKDIIYQGFTYQNNALADSLADSEGINN
jgi:hypothetical protein